MLVRAPGGLGFVQDLVNTRYVGTLQPLDQLSDLDLGRNWLSAALRRRAVDGGFAVDVSIDDRDLTRLRELRATLIEAMGGPASTRASSASWQGPAVSTRMNDDGALTLEPQGDGYRYLAGRVAVDVFVAQQIGTWSRLKVCRNAACGIGFYDRSPNASAVWHDARVCGNAANLRASRARRRVTQG